MAKKFTPRDTEAHTLLDEAEKASSRAKELTYQLLTFSRGGTPLKKVESIAAMLKDTANFVLRGSNVRCEFEIPEDLWPVEVDTGQFSQVINNIIINADQAMPEGGIVNISAENIRHSHDKEIPLQPGDYIKIMLEDHGIGIPKKYLNRIFDPYFSTKQEGSGLGLAITHSIINQHSGFITVESEPGRGTSFYIYLPASKKKAKKDLPQEAEVPMGKGKILVMDDIEALRDMLCKMLQFMGYESVPACDGHEALLLYSEALKGNRPFNAVILDLTIPGSMGGKDTISRLLAIDPAVIAFVSSGYSNDPIMANYRDYGFAGVIPKPFKMEQVGSLLKKAIYGK